MNNRTEHAFRTLVCLIAALATGCASDEAKDRDFFTSGSREADQRAEQRIAKTQQLRGEGEGGADTANVKKSLYERLGGEQGVRAIVDDFVTRALADPRVNWERKGIERGGMNIFKRNQSVEWKPTADRVETLKKHLSQFIALSTGGPSTYEGRDMREVHRGLHISNAEFDAAVGDLKATLDKVGVPTEEQKELLAIIESTRPQVAEKR
jgi:hemoglobin